MANLTAKKMELSQINGGKQYTNADGLQAETINAVVESGAWVQALATNTPDTSQANKVGTPSVTIGTANDGTPKFVFSYLKGAEGHTPIKGTDYKDGVDGKTPKLQMSGNTLQVRYDDESNWRDLYTFPWYEGETS